MPAPQTHITASTPMGATLTAGGATFRVWAPAAQRVYVALGGANGYRPQPEDELVKDPATGHWTGFLAGVKDGTKYRYYVVGAGGEAFKRDPWARELEFGDHENCDCIVRTPDTYPWHDGGWRTPRFADLIVYQLHTGVFYARDDQGRDRRPYRVAKFLDVAGRVPYLADLGVTAIQLLPVVEFHGPWSLGYNGTDLFSPETDYCVEPGGLDPYLVRLNALLADRGAGPLTAGDVAGQINQLKALVDVCHLYGIAVIVDVVYNHAGGNFGPQGLTHFDLPAVPNPHNDLYFTADTIAGGPVFDFAKPPVTDFLIRNARMFLSEYHADGLRFDEVSHIAEHGGRAFCRDLTGTLRHAHPASVLIAEYWKDPRAAAVEPAPAGLGFDIGYADGLRETVREVLAEAAGGAEATVRVGRLRDGLRKPWGFPDAWRAYNCLENHDLVLDMDGHGHRRPRIAELAGGGHPRSWYARSRARAATGLLITAPGTPMLFMGQEFLEDKQWSDNPTRGDRMIWWDGLGELGGGDGPGEKHMRDFHRHTRDLLHLRRRLPALRAEPVNVFHTDEVNRVVAFHRWVPDAGQDVVVVCGFGERTFYGQGYRLGFPRPGRWAQVHNSDFYDHFPNPEVQGDPAGVRADGPPLHGLPHSAGVTLPANSLLVFEHVG